MGQRRGANVRVWGAALLLASTSCGPASQDDDPVACADLPDPPGTPFLPRAAWRTDGGLLLEFSDGTTTCDGTTQYWFLDQLSVRSYEGPGDYSSVDGAVSYCIRERNLDGGEVTEHCPDPVEVEVVCDDTHSVLLSWTFPGGGGNDLFARANLCPEGSYRPPPY